MAGLDVGEILARRSGEELALHERYMNPQFVRVLETIGFDRTWVSGSGAHLVDSEGEPYLDLISGYGVFALGRNHPAVRAQLERLLAAETPNMPQLGTAVLPGVLAEELLRRAPGSVGAVLFTSSGTESVEAAMKLARAATGRPRILHWSGSFHGLTYGALSICGEPEFRDRFGPFLPGCEEVPFGDVAALERELARGDVAAFFFEPVIGHGVYIPSRDLLSHAQELCRRHGTLLVADEVQTGLGRTGRFLAVEHWGVEPDLVTLSKALSGGYVPVGAVLASRTVFDSVFDSMRHAVAHGSTFGPNDLASAAGLATLSVLDDEGLVARAARLGQRLLDLTKPLAERHEIVRDVRGLGMMWAIEFGRPSGAAARRLWDAVEAREPGLFTQLVVGPLFHEHRILTQAAGHNMNVLKALPPLVTEESELERFAAALDDVIARAARFPRAMARFGLGVARRRARRRPPPATTGATTSS
jgi:ornithine--oxo-acid transaminase